MILSCEILCYFKKSSKFKGNQWALEYIETNKPFFPCYVLSALLFVCRGKELNLDRVDGTVSINDRDADELPRKMPLLRDYICF